MTEARRNLLLGLLAGLTAALVWGAQAVIARTGTLAGFNPVDLSVLRFVTAAVALSPFLWTGRHALRRIGVRRIFWLSVFGGFGNTLLFCSGVVYAPASHGGTIAPITAAVAGAVLAGPFLGDWPTRGRVLSLVALGLGLVLIGWDGLTGEHPGAWRGDLLLFGAGGVWGVFTVMLRRWAVPALPGMAAVFLCSALVMLPPWVMLGLGAVPDLPWQASALQMVGQGLGASVIATTLYARAVALLGATKAGCVGTMMPVVALMLSAWLLGESLGRLKLAGVAVAVAAMLAAVLFTGRREAT